MSETIDSIVQESGGYKVTIRLEPGVGQGRTEAVMEVTSTSEIYDYVIPLRALHNEGGNYIYVLEEKNGILGTELSVRSLTVRLLDQNEDYEAIADELLSGDIKIVTESDRELENGIAVKEWERVGRVKRRIVRRGEKCYNNPAGRRDNYVHITDRSAVHRGRDRPGD